MYEFCPILGYSSRYRENFVKFVVLKARRRIGTFEISLASGSAGFLADEEGYEPEEDAVLASAQAQGLGL